VTERLFVRLDGDEIERPQSGAPGGVAAWPVSAPLSRHVSHILIYKEEFAAGQSVIERVVPDGSVRLIVNLADAPSVAGQRSEPLEIVGASAAPAIVRLSGTMHGVSITLRAGAVAGLLGLPAGELAGQAVALEQVWQSDARELRERLVAAPDDRARQAIMDALLLRRLGEVDKAPHRTAVRAVQLFAQCDGRLSVREVAHAVGVGERRLQQLFHTHVGLSPRTWRRLARLRGCLRLVRKAPSRSWANVALDSGYYDQSHLVNELRALAGLTPSQLSATGFSHSSKTAG
jgi:AraC-like DNA-binding protein